MPTGGVPTGVSVAVVDAARWASGAAVTAAMIAINAMAAARAAMLLEWCGVVPCGGASAAVRVRWHVYGCVCTRLCERLRVRVGCHVRVC